MIEKILSSGLKIEKTEMIRREKFQNKTFIFTGTLSKYTRGEAKRIVEKEGGKVVSAVSKKTDFVVAGEDVGSKFEKAKRLGVAIISEDEFIRMIEGSR